MTWETVVRFAPAYDSRHLIDGAANPPGLVVSHDAIHRKKLSELTPVVVDHEMTGAVGRIQSTFIGEDVDYGTRIRKWWFASCELDEKPEWLKRGSGVSWSWYPLHSYTAENGAGTEVLTSCLIEEVSLLSPALAPAEPLARVCYVKETPPLAQRHHAKPKGEVTFGHGQMIIRPNIGKVLSVR